MMYDARSLPAFKLGDRVWHELREQGDHGTVVEYRGIVAEGKQAGEHVYGVEYDSDKDALWIADQVTQSTENYMHHVGTLTIDAPVGVNPKDAIGMKKPPLHLVPTALNIYAAQAMRNGAAKYGPFNWRTKPIIASVYVSAALRHLNAWFDGEERAEDSNVEHLAHCVASLAILIDAIECGNVVDDRPAAGPAPKLIERFTES